MNYKLFIRILPIMVLFVTQSFGQCNDFVKVQGKKFKCGQSDFFPIVANYVMEVHNVAGVTTPISFPTYFPTRSHLKFPNNTTSPNSVTQQQSYDLIVRDLKAMKLVGFNTIRTAAVSYGRACDLSYNCCDPNSQVPCSLQVGPYPKTSGAGFWSFDALGQIPTKISTTSPGSSSAIYNNLLLDIMDNILKAAAEAGVKVILLIGSGDLVAPGASPTVQSDYLIFLQQFATRFKYNPTLLAVDFMNEPTPDDDAYWKKSDACNITKAWNDAIKSNSQILTTIGLSEIGSMYWWDPNLLPVDFISLHNYPHSTSSYANDFTDAVNRIKSDYFWYQNNLTIPWIVGETGLSAHPANTTHPINTSLDPGNGGTLTDQANYLEATIAACRDYGGAGYSWWDFMDEGTNAAYTYTNGGPYWGLAKIHDGNINTPYDWKPAAAKVTAFNPNTTPTNPGITPNYYNYYYTPNIGKGVDGRVMSVSPSVGIKDALVEVVDAANKYYYVYTDASGYYTVYTYNNVIRITATATECQTAPQLIINNVPHVINANFYLAKIPRPTVNTLTYANQNIYSASVNDFAVTNAAFSNYNLFTGNFNIIAGSYITLNTGFSAKSGSNFKARIGPYYHDCSTLKDANNVAFKTAAATPDLGQHQSESKIFPNPGTGNYQITMAKDDQYTLDIYNAVGQKIRTGNFTGTDYKVNLENESHGVYLFIIRNNKDVTEMSKIIKE